MNDDSPSSPRTCQSCLFANLYCTYCNQLERPIYPDYMNTDCQYHRKLKPTKIIK